MSTRTKTESAATRDESRQWRGRPALSIALSIAVTVLPIAVSVAATRLAAHLVHRPHSSLAPAIAWWTAILVLATVVVFAVERLTRRLAPLAALLKLSLVFPDRAPSRFSVALRSGTVNQLQDRYEAVKRDGLGATPAEAARKVVELIGALNAHDRVTRGHCERVRAYTALIAEELKLPEEEIDRLRWAGLLHDLGKLDVPTEILNKKGGLDDDEWAIIKLHPGAGARIAAPLADWLGDAFLAIGEHHERWDGAGYPNGLAGEQISLGGRIVAVADTFDVMTAARSYKRPNTPSWSRAELVRCAEKQFDPVVVRAFLNVSLGRLRWTMGPLSWLAQLPMLAQAPIASATGTLATTAMAATVAVGATAIGALPAAAAGSSSKGAAPTTVFAAGQPPPLVVTDPVTGDTIVLTTTTTAAGSTTIAAGSPVDQGTTTSTANVVAAPTEASTTTDPPQIPTTEPSVTVPTTAPATEATTVTTATPVTATSASPSTTVSSNRAPVAVGDSRMASDAQAPRVNVNVLTNDSDSDGDRLSIVSFTQPAGSPRSVSLHGDQLRYQPLIARPATFTYTISDGHGHTATATVTITLP
jgi:HD-GYP domain-containing protein (c-di-GMP phosphodiesterase class II)